MSFSDLTWDDLTAWAGSRVVARGKGYRGAVRDLGIAADGRLLAWVQGGDRYATVVRLDESGKLSAVCTCPYGFACKHAVATVLAYLARVQAGESVAAVGRDDPRLARLAEVRGYDAHPSDPEADDDEWSDEAEAERADSIEDEGSEDADEGAAEDAGEDAAEGEDADEDDDEDEHADEDDAAEDEDDDEDADDEDDDDDDDDDDADADVSVSPPVARPGPLTHASGRRAAEDPEAAVGRYLDSLDAAELRDLLRALAATLPAVRTRILDRARQASGDVASLVAATEREIEKVSSEPGWTHHWSNERFVPDYSSVQERLELLLAAGHADEVVGLGELLLDRGMEQVGDSDDEGETAEEVAACIAIVMRALVSSSLSGPERLLWEIDARLGDSYGVLDGIIGPSDAEDDDDVIPPSDWSAVADQLGRRMDATAEADRSEAGGHSAYHRGAVMRWLLHALEQSGRQAEIAPILEREVEITQCYTDLVDHLLACGNDDAAAAWARKGFARTIGTAMGIAWSLEERLRDMAESQQDLPMVGALRALEFFDRPSPEQYAAIRAATSPLVLWDTVRPMLLHWLETGARPDVPGPAHRGGASEDVPVDSRAGAGSEAAAPRGHKAAGAMEARGEAWPLPPTGLDVPGENARHRTFPDMSNLIAIALQERRHDDALRWLALADRRGSYGRVGLGEPVAEAVQETHPDAALAIWKSLAIAQIAQVNRGAYEAAGVHLQRMKAVYQRTDRLAEWELLLKELRTANARRPRMIDVLDELERGPSRIIET